jgi:tRNA (adenine37-N6)-methyltransferase
MFTIEPIGIVRGGRVDAVDDGWGAVEATIEIDPARFGLDALVGLDEFSHVEVVYVFHAVDPAKVTMGSRRPRGNPDWPEVGILAQRARLRPNRLGVSTCELLGVDGLTIHVRALDAIDGTPVVDVKPFMTGFLPRGEVRQPDWAIELMRDYWRR